MEHDTGIWCDDLQENKKQPTRENTTWRPQHLGPNTRLRQEPQGPKKTKANSLQKGRAVVEATYV